ATPFEGLWMLKDMPEWLRVLARSEHLKAAMGRSIPEFASGAMALEHVRPARNRLKDGVVDGMFELTVRDPGGARRVVCLRGVADPGRPVRVEAISPGVPFPEDGWRGAVPELRLALETPPRDTAVPALAMLTDPSRARSFLEGAIRAGSPAYVDIRIEGCTPKMARYKFGSRCTIIYRLEYGPEAAGRDWPEAVVAKTYSGNEGRVAYEGMRAVWESQLRWSTTVTIAEPLAFIPELEVLIQSAVPGKLSLKDLVTVLPGGTASAMAELRGLLAKTGRGLAALHACTAHGTIFSWEQQMAEVRERIVRLASWVPGFDGALEPALARLEALAASHPADRPVPSHGSFRPAQVLLHEGHIAFIDFDGFCGAEPAMDLALFRAGMKQTAMRLGSREELPEPSLEVLSELDGLCDLFLDEYERATPVSRERVALWETLYLLESVLKSWTKVEPYRLEASMALLERHVRHSALSLA
ncbi:MAG TPA: phosphotransferase, partial [Solirubrobacterales bacterium]|nr:phosphotransferase [Solirubrobacterales bacterium]